MLAQRKISPAEFYIHNKIFFTEYSPANYFETFRLEIFMQNLIFWFFNKYGVYFYIEKFKFVNNKILLQVYYYKTYLYIRKYYKNFVFRFSGLFNLGYRKYFPGATKSINFANFFSFLTRMLLKKKRLQLFFRRPLDLRSRKIFYDFKKSNIFFILNKLNKLSMSQRRFLVFSPLYNVLYQLRCYFKKYSRNNKYNTFINFRNFKFLINTFSRTKFKLDTDNHFYKYANIKTAKPKLPKNKFFRSYLLRDIRWLKKRKKTEVLQKIHEERILAENKFIVQKRFRKQCNKSYRVTLRYKQKYIKVFLSRNKYYKVQQAHQQHLIKKGIEDVLHINKLHDKAAKSYYNYLGGRHLAMVEADREKKRKQQWVNERYARFLEQRFQKPFFKYKRFKKKKITGQERLTLRIKKNELRRIKHSFTFNFFFTYYFAFFFRCQTNLLYKSIYKYLFNHQLLRQEYAILSKRSKYLRKRNKWAFDFLFFLQYSVTFANTLFLWPFLVYHIKRTFKRHGATMQIIINVLRTIFFLKPYFKGFKIMIKGPFDRHGRSRKLLLHLGHMGFSKYMSHPILYDMIHCPIVYGMCSIKFWMAYE